MKKIIVVILGFMVGSIFPVTFIPADSYFFALLTAIAAIIIFGYAEHDGPRFLSIFVASAVLGGCISISETEWYVAASNISLIIFIIMAVVISAILGLRSQNEKEHNNTKKAELNTNEDEEE